VREGREVREVEGEVIAAVSHGITSEGGGCACLIWRYWP